MDFLLKVLFFCDFFNEHETHWTHQVSEWHPVFVTKTYKGFCALSLPAASQPMKHLRDANTWAGLCVFLGFLTNRAPVHAKLDGGFSDMDAQSSALPTPYVPISQNIVRGLEKWKLGLIVGTSSSSICLHLFGKLMIPSRINYSLILPWFRQFELPKGNIVWS